MDLTYWFLLLYTGLTCYAAGQNWLIQIVVYPLFRKVGEDKFAAYHGFYLGRITFPLVVPGLVYILLAVPLVFVLPDAVPAWMGVGNAVCALGVLAITVALEIPRHRKLEKDGKQEAVIEGLIFYQWPRTLAFTLSAALALAAFASA